MADEQETRATLQRYADAWAGGDVDTVFGSYADDIVFHYSGSTDLAGDHVGKDAAVTAMIAASTRCERELLEILDVLAGSRFGALVVRERLSRDGDVAEVRRTLVFRVEADQLVECWLLDEDQALIDRFWTA
jgi:ketosteroid isomerase-like protein